MPTPVQRTTLYQTGSYQSNRSQVYDALASKLQGFKSQLDQRLDEEARAQGLAAGRASGFDAEAIEMPDGSTISGAAFREGANTSHLAAVKLDINENLSRIAGQTAGDPDAFMNRVSGYQNGLLEGTSPEVRPIALQEIAYASSKIEQKFRADAAQRDRDEQSAIVETGLSSIETEALNAARGGDETDVEKSSQQYLDMMFKAENSGLFPAGETVKRVNALQSAMLEEVYLGSFDRELAAGRGVEFMADFHKNKDFSPETRAKLAAKMVSSMSAKHKIADAEDKLESDERRQLHEETERDITLQALNGTLTTEVLKAHLEDDSIDPGFARTMDKVASAQGVLHDDDAVKLDYNLDLLAVPERTIAEDERLTRDTRMALISDRRALEDDAGNWRRTQNGSEATRRIKAEFGMVDGLIAQLDPEKAKRAGRALTSLYEQVEMLPLEQRAGQAVAISNQIIKDLKLGDSVEDLRFVNERLGKMKYQTTKDLDLAIDNGDIGGHEAKVLRKRLDFLLQDKARLESEAQL